MRITKELLKSRADKIASDYGFDWAIGAEQVDDRTTDRAIAYGRFAELRDLLEDS
jgi:hypothetical protein